MNKFRLFFDTETTGLVLKGVPLFDPRQPNLLQFGAMLDNEARETIITTKFLVKPYWEGEVPEGAVAIHGITREKCEEEGVPEYYAQDLILGMFGAPSIFVDRKFVAHNLNYDRPVLEKFLRDRMQCETGHFLPDNITICTMLSSVKFCNLPSPRGPKWPKLEELYRILFNEELVGAHDALDDVKATRRCYYELVDRKIIKEL